MTTDDEVAASMPINSVIEEMSTTGDSFDAVPTSGTARDKPVAVALH